MKSVTTERFRAFYRAATLRQQARIKQAYKHWLVNPAHPSIRFKKVHDSEPIYSARVDLDWRALGVLEADTVIWFWVGPHDEYEALIGRL